MNKFKVGETVITIKGPKVITEVKKDVLIFGPGEFAPKDMVTKIPKGAFEGDNGSMVGKSY